MDCHPSHWLSYVSEVSKPPTSNKISHWLIFFKMVKTTNQLCTLREFNKRPEMSGSAVSVTKPHAPGTWDLCLQKNRFGLYMFIYIYIYVYIYVYIYGPVFFWCVQFLVKAGSSICANHTPESYPESYPRIIPPKSANHTPKKSGLWMFFFGSFGIAVASLVIMDLTS